MSAREETLMVIVKHSTPVTGTSAEEKIAAPIGALLGLVVGTLVEHGMFSGAQAICQVLAELSLHTEQPGRSVVLSLTTEKQRQLTGHGSENSATNRWRFLDLILGRGGA